MEEGWQRDVVTPRRVVSKVRGRPSPRSKHTDQKSHDFAHKAIWVTSQTRAIVLPYSNSDLTDVCDGKVLKFNSHLHKTEQESTQKQESPTDTHK